MNTFHQFFLAISNVGEFAYCNVSKTGKQGVGNTEAQMNKTYADLLKSPLWQKKRLQIMERDGWKCTNCLCETEQLHVHHEQYLSSCLPWEYPDELLKTLCDTCHKSTHGIGEWNLDEYISSNEMPVPIGVEIEKFFNEKFGVSICLERGRNV